jgi:hypothetical protein
MPQYPQTKSSDKPSSAKVKYLPSTDTVYAEKCNAESAGKIQLHKGITNVTAANMPRTVMHVLS